VGELLGGVSHNLSAEEWEGKKAEHDRLVKEGHKANNAGSALGAMECFEEAAKAYEDLGFKYAEGPLKHSAKEQFFRSFICRLATITPDNSMERGAEARDALDVYLGSDSHFRGTREAEACEMLLCAVEDADEAKFDEVIGNLNELKMLDDMKSHALLKVKAGLTDVR